MASQIFHPLPRRWPALKIQKPRTGPSLVYCVLWLTFSEAINSTWLAATCGRRWSQCTSKHVEFSSKLRPSLIFQSVSLPCAKHGVGAREPLGVHCDLLRVRGHVKWFYSVKAPSWERQAGWITDPLAQLCGGFLTMDWLVTCSTLSHLNSP